MVAKVEWWLCPVVVVVVVADGRGDWCYVCIFFSRIYYFIVVIILFYCDVYIILLR